MERSRTKPSYRPEASYAAASAITLTRGRCLVALRSLYRHRPLAAIYAALKTKGSRRSSTRATCTADHSPSPRAVGMPCSFSPAEMARRVVAPAACNAAIVGARSAALAAARSRRVAADRLRIRAVGMVPWLPPSFLPRRFAAASAALVLLGFHTQGGHNSLRASHENDKMNNNDD